MAISTPKNILVSLGILFLVLFAWEHYGRKTSTQLRPSIFLTSIATTLQKFWQYLGELVAKVSSYLIHLDFTELFETVYALVNPIISIVASFLYFIKGYACKAASYETREWLVYAGSALLAALIGFGLYYLNKKYDLLNYICNRFAKRQEFSSPKRNGRR